MKQIAKYFAIFVLCLFVMRGETYAVEPAEMLDDPVLEARARQISKGLRCIVCQNESIDESQAELAHDLRRLVRDRLVSGDSDTVIIDYIVERYGDYVLLSPPFKASTWALWLTPFILSGLAGWIGWRVVSSRSEKADPGAVPLNEDERARLTHLLPEEWEHSEKDRL